MEEKELIEIEDKEGNKKQVEVITYLISEDGLRKYLVYSQGEIQGPEEDHVIYISKIHFVEGKMTLEEIVDDAEWNDVQRLLKKIANAE